jgi:hypothetical protein
MNQVEIDSVLQRCEKRVQWSAVALSQTGAELRSLREAGVVVDDGPITQEALTLAELLDDLAGAKRLAASPRRRGS